MQHKVNQVLVSPPLVLVAVISLFLPLCTGSTCPLDNTRPMRLNIIENFGENTNSIDGEVIIDFKHEYEGDEFVIFNIFSVNEDIFRNHFELVGGRLSNRGWIDRESIALELHDPYGPVLFEFDILFLDVDVEAVYSCINVTLHVVDLDDNSPVFEDEMRVVTFTEDDDLVNREKDIPTADDHDEGRNGTSVYELVDNSGKFELVYRNYSGTTRVQFLSLKNISPLDHEQNSSYYLQLLAREDNESPDMDTLNIHVRVTDLCDEPPEFTTSRYTPHISENATVDASVVTVGAIDADNHAICPLSYSISRVCARETEGDNCDTIDINNQPFDLDSESGRLTLQEEVDREMYAEYEVTVQATDRSQSSATATVVISIEDINDNCPVILHEILPTINERQTVDPNRPIGHIKVTDADAGRNGQVIVHLQENSTDVAVVSETFTLTTQNQRDYQIILSQSLDFESQKEFSLVIHAQDNGTQPCFVSVPVSIIIRDHNDHPPVFVNLPSEVSIPENSVMSTEVMFVNTIDLDTGINAITRYELPESNATYPHQHLFQIEYEVGLISVGSGILNYEEFTNYTILVVAKNSESSDPLSSSAELTVLLENTNDNKPQIMLPAYLEVSETAESGETIGQVIATDPDNLAPLTYSLTTFSSLFSISGDGIISLEGDLDYETRTSYLVLIEVSDGQHTSLANATIDVLPVNDEEPTFTEPGPYVMMVLEEEQDGELVGRVTATDRDIPPDNLQFSIEQGRHRERFSIYPSGEIYTTESLDRETTPNYTLWIQVSDGVFVSGLKKVTIRVKDTNDHVPEFIGLPYIFRIEERNAEVQYVGQVEVLSLDEGANQAWRFEIPAGSAYDWFRIDENTGIIETNNHILDSETDPSPIELTVFVNDLGSPPNMNMTIVHVVIVDINDNGPKWTEPLFEFTLREDYPIGQVFGSVVASDIDGIGNNETIYSFSDGTDAGKFHIDESTGKLSLVSSLDFETTNLTTFEVIATDAGRGDLQTPPVTVMITITNARDLNLSLPIPFFPHYFVKENVEANYTITSLEVTDTMFNSIDRLVYTLTTPENAPSPYFGIRKEGYEAVIYTRTDSIDREANDLGNDKTYRLKLNVSDPDTTQDSYGYIVSYLTFEILDENDNPPKLCLTKTEFSVWENGDAGELVDQFEVKDPDAGNNGTIHLNIESVEQFNVTLIEQNNGQRFAELRVVSSLDREVQSMYQFYLRATDQGTPSRHTTIQINVLVMDVNDNDPIFVNNDNPESSKNQCTFHVREDYDVDQVIATLHATDRDAGTNAEIRYEVVPGNRIGSEFHLEANTGEIILLKSLDRETRALYEFDVRAVDGGNRASTATVVFIIDDVNEYPPEFTNSSFTIPISEDITTGVPFTSLIAVDPENTAVEYVLADESLNKIFRLDRLTGKISIRDLDLTSLCIFTEVIDYERLNEYKVGIIAYDHGKPRLYSNKTLTVQITDVNEHTPLFDVSQLYILLSENAEIGSTVLEIQAYDLDVADHLQYTLVQQAPGTMTHFQWDIENNALILSNPIDYVANHLLEVQLRVEDGEKHSDIEIFILVLNENNHQPVIETQDSTLSISENTAVASNIFAVYATDVDNATNDAVVYSMSAGNIDDVFYINPKTGVLYIAQDLDYENQPGYTLTVIAMDTGEPAMFSEPLYITIEVINENDEEPIFVESEYSFSLVESNAEMAQVGCVSAQDRDKGDFGVVVYSIVEEGEHPGFFSIDKHSGCISAIQTIDREKISEFQLLVQAQDKDSPTKTDTVAVTVTISDINDNGPTFSQAFFHFYIYPDYNFSQPVGMITAFDSDSGVNASFSYEIVSPDPNLEVSLTENGYVSLVTAIPSNYQASYRVDVRVSSNVAGDVRFDDATILIIVESETDHHPRFDQLYEERVSESVGVGSTIFCASEVVKDDDGISGLTYAFVGNYEQFALDSETGLLTLQVPLNYEETDSYDIQIQATDNFSHLTRTATATVRIIVEDGNDHAPVFIEVPTNIVLSPVPYTNIELFTVLAEDEDIGDQGTVGYSIVEESSSMFEINRETGVVTNRVNLIANDTYVFVIRAFDRGSPLMSSNITVRVRIDDPENSPQFPNGDTTIGISLPENKNIKTDPIIREFSTQPVAESYHLVYSNGSKDMFAIELSTNNLVLKSQLDYETASQYLLIIEARSVSNGMRLSSFLLVNIIVTDVNDNKPQFLPIVSQRISESQSTYTELFMVQAIDDDSGQNSLVTYAISDGNIGNTFEIDRTTGIIKLVQPLNREIIANYDLTIRASDAGTPVLQKEASVLIEVIDVNDNAPHFSQTNYSVSVFEYPHTVIDDSIIQIVAEDIDAGPPITYYLQLLEGTYMGNQRSPSSDTFKIDFDTGNITTHRNLDREEIDRYFIRIEARDSIVDHTSVAYLTIHVRDVNDHSPEFPNGAKDITVYELLPENTLVLRRQQVTDQDLGPNSLVKYYLGDNWPPGNFKIDPWSGVIRVARSFAYDIDHNRFEGTVLAVDQGVPARTGTMTVSVTIRDVNNFPPVLDASHFSLEVSVNHSRDTPIKEFNYSDEGDNSFNRYTIVVIPYYYIDAHNLFEIVLGILKFRRPATSDDVGEHHFRIQATQQSSVPNCPQYNQATYAHVTVTVHPENTRAPTFPRPLITLVVEESVMPGTELNVADLLATDADNDNIFYSILSAEDLPFAITDPSSPAISTTGILDADSISTAEYMIMVQARDDGFPIRSSNVTLTIRVQDVNDLPPRFKNELYSGRVTENSIDGTFVLRVFATDPDLGISDTIYYTIEYPEDCDINCLPFAINSSGDVVTTKNRIDYEEFESYMFRVKASDSIFTSFATLTIDVLGVNEFTPVFDIKLYEITVKASQAKGSLVGKVTATDLDVGMDGKLHFSFVDQLEEQYDVFVINETSGEIFLAIGTTERTVDSNSRRKRSVNVMGETVIISRVVMVQDSAEVPQSDTTEVIITIDKVFFDQVDETEPGSAAGAADAPFEIIIIVVIAVVIAIIVFVAIITVALLFRHHSRNKRFKIEDTQVHETGRGGLEMTSERYCRNGNVTSLGGKTVTTKLQTVNSASGSERSYTGTADDEMDSGNEGIPRFTGHSPNLPNKSHRPCARSTSDLASSVGTDALHSQANEHPYTKAQIMRIYAANEELLDDNVSHDSVHMFGSEGGGEADGDLDINNLIFQKINDLEDDEESTTIMDDDASTTYSKGRGTVLTGSVGNNMDILPAEDREDPLNYPDTRKGWIPPSGRPIDEAIDEITATSSFASQEEPLPRRHGYDMSTYSHSQGPSLYNPSATQESFIGLQQLPKLYHNNPKRLMHDYSHHYYAEDHEGRLVRDHERERLRFTPRSNPRYGSASVLPANPDYRPGQRQHYRSQDLIAPYPAYIPGVRRPMGHSHAYMTPTEGTDDGTVTPQTALTAEYNYLSSSSTSLTSTNVSGNLSQPSRRPQMYN